MKITRRQLRRIICEAVWQGHEIIAGAEPQKGDRVLFTRNMQTAMYSDDRINLKQGVITRVEEDRYGGDDLTYWIKFDGEKNSSGFGRRDFKVLAQAGTIRESILLEGELASADSAYEDGFAGYHEGREEPGHHFRDFEDDWYAGWNDGKSSPAGDYDSRPQGYDPEPSWEDSSQGEPRSWDPKQKEMRQREEGRKAEELEIHRRHFDKMDSEPYE